MQNHLLQVLALAAMEPPSGGDDAIPRRRLDVFRAMPGVDPDDAVRGQYEGYREIEGVSPKSDTETFVALRLEIENWRWAGIPIFIRAGRPLARPRSAAPTAGSRPAGAHTGFERPALTTSSSASAETPG